MINKKICITFAGAAGCSKTPISNYLSTRLNLPVFNNDAIRSEVIEDLGVFDSEEHIKRRNARLKEIAASGISFICDASVDREWGAFKEQFEANGYSFFIISLDLSKDLLERLYRAKGYFEFLEVFDKFVEDHDAFLSKHGDDIGLHISDEDFAERLRISCEKAAAWIGA